MAVCIGLVLLPVLSPFSDLTMDHLSYDLVEEVVRYLPRRDVKTIARVSSRSSGLEEWNAAAEDQLENRFALDVRVYIQKQKKVPDPLKEDAMDADDSSDDSSDGSSVEEEVESKIFLSVLKHLPNGQQEQWNFLQWRLAWIRNLTIETTVRDCAYPEADLHEVLRSVSLPVDPSIRSVLKVDHGDPDMRTVGISWKILQATQKDAFADVFLRNCKNGDPDEFGDLVSNWIQRGGIWEKLRCDGSFPPKKAIEAVAPLFGGNRGRPLELELPDVCINPDFVLLIIDNWWNSDGTFEEKQVTWKQSRRASVWNRIENKSKNRKKCNHNFTMLDSDSGYLVHHSRRSTLSISLKGIRVEKFQPWHVPVDFQWMDSVIAKWREGNGFYLYGEERKFFFTWESAQDWDKIRKKYCPLSHNCIKLTHWSEVLTLQHEDLKERELMSIISDWKKGNGETFIKELTEVEVQVYIPSPFWKRLLDDPVLEYTHPNKNARCVIALQPMPTPRTVGYSEGPSRVVRISICPSDPQPV
uniref:F-box domain-containing protein n=1 Tax=Steinernema glaseri TaxID=37863 RepID=A0A1I7Z0P5_9BILA